MNGKWVAVVVGLILSMAFRGSSAADSESDVDNLVFVGRLVSIEELPNPCEATRDCIMMDSLWRARYEILQPIVGAHPQKEIAIDIADHYGFPYMARFRHALLFVGLYSDGRWLHKYQGFDVHPLSDGGWASCGGPLRDEDPGSPRPLPFAGDIELVGFPGAEGTQEMLDPDYFSVQDGRVRCKRGIPLADLYEMARKGALQAREVELPPWSEIEPAR